MQTMCKRWLLQMSRDTPYPPTPQHRIKEAPELEPAAVYHKFHSPGHSPGTVAPAAVPHPESSLNPEAEPGQELRTSMDAALSEVCLEKYCSTLNVQKHDARMQMWGGCVGSIF